MVGNYTTYRLPQSQDNDGDAVTITINLGVASVFTTYSNNILTYEPLPDDIGIYTITVNLTDSGKPTKY